MTPSASTGLEHVISRHTVTSSAATGLGHVISRRTVRQDIGRVNQHGVKRLDLCKLHIIYIRNGRCGTDKCIGKVTSKDCSLIDYAIGTHHVFINVAHFQICDFDPLLFDIHCALLRRKKEGNVLFNDAHNTFYSYMASYIW